ncbi:MAG: hypothetical protein IPH93_02115 [Saprospiraceae bacterium]|nr:hypothetical protein [Saprospiraceae bacterium]MBK7810293.1 hypothetical protein [Saprospiraceae bacterium]
MKKLNFTILYLVLFNLGNMMAQVIQGQINQQGGTAGFNQGIGLGGPSIESNYSPVQVNNPSMTPAPDEGPRNVFWVHGLNGDIGSWARAATASQFNVAPSFPARKVISNSNFTYTQSSSLLDASAQVGTWIRGTKDNDPKKDFLIAHSQGGLVSRGLLHLNLCTTPKSKPDFGGLVTFCSSHQGANLLSKLTEFKDLGVKMCTELNDGPFLEGFSDFKIFGLPLPWRLGKSLLVKVDSLCSDFTETVFPLLLNKETPNITKDYVVGAPLLKKMNDCLDGNRELEVFPKVAFYGVEPKDHLMLRTILYFSKSSQGPDYFQANDDHELISNFDTIYSKYRRKYETYANNYYIANDQYNKLECYKKWKILPPPCYQLKKDIEKYKILKEAYLKGVNFLDQMDDQYKLIIGALELKKEVKLYCKCTNLQTGEEFENEISNPSECKMKITKNIFCDIFSKVNYYRIEKDSDGVVLAESASNLPGATFAPQEMKNSSHMQARNDEELRKGLIKLYEGGTDLYFYTKRK